MSVVNLVDPYDAHDIMEVYSCVEFVVYKALFYRSQPT